LAGKFDEQQKQVMDDMLLGIPGVKAGRMFGYPAYKLDGKAFAFVVQNGVAIKLPQARAEALINAGGDITYFHPGNGTIAWKEWVLIHRESADDYRNDYPLFEESLQFLMG
jgi:hypothetical protein